MVQRETNGPQILLRGTTGLAGDMPATITQGLGTFQPRYPERNPQLGRLPVSKTSSDWPGDILHAAVQPHRLTPLPNRMVTRHETHPGGRGKQRGLGPSNQG